ncbi:Esterase [Musa troglodytarum]|uniref:Esterase n=1 Tax=Musa troglodytarum TaxID=320322 RepID=A0A9E7G1L9_9LILI|nr:Esterase [Musa troglodytarum]
MLSFFVLAIPISICSHRSTHPNSWLIVVGIGGNERMGNGLACMPKKDLRGGIGSRSRRGSNSRSQRKTAVSEEELLHHQVLAMAIHQHQLSQRFDGSLSRRIGSTSSRSRDLPDSVTTGKLPPAFLENLETKKIILVHGEGFGAWCWYKTMSLLEESGLLPVALDLTGSGIDQTDINSITSLEDYARPLITYLQSLPDDEKLASADLFLQESQFLVYGNGRDKPPTSIMFDKQQIRALYFNQSPPKVRIDANT